MRRVRRLLAALWLGAAPASLAGQSLLYRSPNLSGTWVPAAGVVQFNFAHRFHVDPGPTYTVVNYPTFTTAVGLGKRLALGTHLGTKTLIATSSGSSNELELYARYRVLGTEGSDGFALSVTPAYNRTARSADGEVAVDWTRGRITLSGAARLAGKPLGVSSGARAAFAGGVIARLNAYVAFSADAGAFVGPAAPAAWGAGLNFVIPGSPHTFSLHASNAVVNTIQGNSQGTSQMRYGFEFTIPLHLARFRPWFGGGGSAPHAPTAAETGIAVEVRIVDYKFTDSITVTTGQTVRWTNADAVAHTVTFDRGATSSQELAQGATFVVRFDTPGRFAYHCTPHPFMKGVVIVQ
jgi:plastocyanin